MIYLHTKDGLPPRKLKIEEILKPGAVLETKEINPNNSELQTLFRLTRIRQANLMKQKNQPFRNYTITI